ncbi:uncharacterized protein ATC70_008303 [Mucor velutinosus]|uniref:Uncharacterized protein n=1 Tax=Mucor velutinosus TaxID=708070 RepID=A0AAN7DMP1_9FUNG|nr:hypothetical protein ATC70_008303 [Mucor velutinosus]
MVLEQKDAFKLGLAGEQHIVNGTNLSSFINSEASKRNALRHKKHKDLDVTLALRAIELYVAKKNTIEDLCNALMCMLSHYIYLRNGSSRGAELVVPQFVVYENKEPTLRSGLLFSDD